MPDTDHQQTRKGRGFRDNREVPIQDGFETLNDSASAGKAQKCNPELTQQSRVGSCWWRVSMRKLPRRTCWINMLSLARLRICIWIWIEELVMSRYDRRYFALQLACTANAHIHQLFCRNMRLGWPYLKTSAPKTSNKILVNLYTIEI